jgi:hypothetical protein
MPEIRGAQLTGFLDGSEVAPSKMKEIPSTDKEKEPQTVPNPEYAFWLARDQKVLGYLLKSLSKDILMHVLRMEHAADAWKAVENMFASQSMSKVTNLRIALANTKKLNQTTHAFFAKMQGFADELAAAGKPVPEDELVSFLLAGLGGHYNPLVAAFGIVKNSLTVAELFSQVQAYDQRQEMLAATDDPGFESSANAAIRGRNRGGGGGYRPRPNKNRDDQRYDDNYDIRRQDRRQDDRRQDDRPRFFNNNQQGGRGRAPAGGGRGRGRGRRRTTPWVDTTCQICNREGHAAKDCWYRFQNNGDDSDDAHAYGIDTNWYSDTGATHHITSELNNLSVRDAYNGQDKVNTANGQGMEICHIGNSVIRNPVQFFKLHNILHVPNASKNLLSVHRFALDNHVFS